jgi:uncharacterized membrane-anchored protein YhcB (DUF1043 family)
MPSIDAGNLITLALALIGGLISVVTMRVTISGLSKRVDDQDGDLRSLKDKFDAYRLHVADNYVRHNDLEKVERTLIDRIDNVRDTILAALAGSRSGPRGGQQ